MIRGSKISAAALVPRMRAQELIANNVANAATGGFRRERFAFHVGPGEDAGSAWPKQNVAARPDDAVASTSLTGNPLDLAIDGPGYFAVRGPDGAERYTRAGGFRLTTEGALATAAGHPVLGEGGPIVLPAGGPVRIAPDGSIRAGDQGVGRIRLVTIGADDLVREGQNLFSVREGAAVTPIEGTAAVLQGHLESSNVEPVVELIEMMRVLREYETNHQAMKTQGATLGRLIEQNLR